jgi:predicted alpha/beta hydrolase family esterase
MSANLRLTSIARRRLQCAPTDPYTGPVGSAPIRIVPGLNDSGPGHWQTLWQEARPEFKRVIQRAWGAPDLEAWAETLASAFQSAGAPPLIAAHSFGCLATVRAAIAHRAPVRAALLVAPADPERFGVDELVARSRLPFASIVVGSTDDPGIKLVKAGSLATTWGSRLVVYRNAGHLNTESGFGPWPDGLRLLRQLDAAAERADTSCYAS